MAFSLFNKKGKILTSEKELVDLAKKDKRYFTPIYKKYHEPIFRFVYQRLDSKDDASDITSQVFLKALVNLKNTNIKGFRFQVGCTKLP